MMKKGLYNKYIISVSALGICLVFLWAFFYLLTIEAARRNIALQAQTGSDTIISGVEEALLSLENTAELLSKNPGLSDAASNTEPLFFYDQCASFLSENPLLLFNSEKADHIIVYNEEGLFYRLKGSAPNTTLKRIFNRMENGSSKTLSVTSNEKTYIGSFEEIRSDGRKTGYVALLMDQSRLERLLGMYNDLDYLSAVLLSEGRLLCSGRESDITDLEEIRRTAVFMKEKAIGLSGFRLLVYCKSFLSSQLSFFFRLALPLTALILVFVVLSFIRYQNRHMIEPINSVISGTRRAEASPLPHTGEETIDGLVDHVNEMLLQIEDREKALYESKIRIREFELEKERTLIFLLKKQINAHFTVNTLNVVRALINKGEREMAAGICDELSTLLRYANAGEETISLLEEFYVLEQYVGIMQARYPDRLHVSIEADDSFEDVFIPRMLIQPVVENAILHGLAGEEGEILVTAEITDSGIMILVRDNGKGMEEEKLREILNDISEKETPVPEEDIPASTGVSHIALKNIQRRIRLVCGEQYGLKLRSNPGEGTEVRIFLPLLK